MTEPNDEDRERAQAVIDAWLDDDGPDDECAFIAREFAAVRAAERERCAKVAHDFHLNNWYATGASISAAIREGK